MRKITFVLLMIILLLSALAAGGESPFPGPDPERKVDDTMLEILNGNLDPNDIEGYPTGLTDIFRVNFNSKQICFDFTRIIADRYFKRIR